MKQEGYKFVQQNIKQTIQKRLENTPKKQINNKVLNEQYDEFKKQNIIVNYQTQVIKQSLINFKDNHSSTQVIQPLRIQTGIPESLSNTLDATALPNVKPDETYFSKIQGEINSAGFKTLQPTFDTKSILNSEQNNLKQEISCKQINSLKQLFIEVGINDYQDSKFTFNGQQFQLNLLSLLQELQQIDKKSDELGVFPQIQLDRVVSNPNYLDHDNKVSERSASLCQADETPGFYHAKYQTQNLNQKMLDDNKLKLGMNFTSVMDDKLQKSFRKGKINFLFNNQEEIGIDQGSDCERSQSDVSNNKLKTILTYKKQKTIDFNLDQKDSQESSFDQTDQDDSVIEKKPPVSEQQNNYQRRKSYFQKGHSAQDVKQKAEKQQQEKNQVRNKSVYSKNFKKKLYNNRAVSQYGGRSENSQFKKSFYDIISQDVPSRQNTKLDPNEDYRINQIDLAFLFASPFQCKFYQNPFDQISYSDEFQKILTSLRNSHSIINYEYLLATKFSFESTLQRNIVGGFHFSGHGWQNSTSFFKKTTDFSTHKDKGDFLMLENQEGDGYSDLLFEVDINNYLEKAKDNLKERRKRENNQEEEVQLPIKFVFLNSCHSEKIGKVFQKAGVQHVICIQQDQVVKSGPAEKFSEYFYQELFIRDSNICTAFIQAQKSISSTYSKSDKERFQLLLFKNPCNCKALNLKKAEDKFKEKQINQFHLPVQVKSFLYRTQEMIDILKQIADHNIVQINGRHGLGTSTLLKNVTCHLAERRIYEDGILYIDFNGVTSFMQAVAELNNYLFTYDEQSLEEFYEYENEDSDDENYQKNFYLNRLKQKFKHFDKFLLSIDNLNDFTSEGQNELFNFFNEVQSQKIKIVFASYKIQYFHGQDKVSFLTIKKLNSENSCNLFYQKIPLGDDHKKDYWDINNFKELHEETKNHFKELQLSAPQIDKCAGNHKKGCFLIKYLSQHPIAEFFGGNPLVISIIAQLTVKFSLVEIFKFLQNKKIDEDQDQDYHFSQEVQQDLEKVMDYKRLVNSLECCTDYLEKQYGNEIIEIWYLIALQGPGILEIDLYEMYCGGEQSQILVDSQKEQVILKMQLDNFLEILQKFAVIEKEILKNKSTNNRFRVINSIKDYLDKKSTHQNQKSALQLVCAQLNIRLQKFKEKYSKQIVTCKTDKDVLNIQLELDNDIQPYEQQIIHLVQMSMKLEKQLKKEMKKNQDKLVVSPKKNNNLAIDSFEYHQGLNKKFIPQVSEQFKLEGFSTFYDKGKNAKKLNIKQDFFSSSGDEGPTEEEKIKYKESLIGPKNIESEIIGKVQNPRIQTNKKKSLGCDFSEDRSDEEFSRDETMNEDYQFIVRKSVTSKKNFLEDFKQTNQKIIDVQFVDQIDEVDKLYNFGNNKIFKRPSEIENTTETEQQSPQNQEQTDLQDNVETFVLNKIQPHAVTQNILKKFTENIKNRFNFEDANNFTLNSIQPNIQLNQEQNLISVQDEDIVRTVSNSGKKLKDLYNNIQIKKKQELELKIHEQLLFHYLSILAVLPKRFGDIFSILDTYGVRSNPSPQTHETSTNLQNNWTKKISVDIPGDNKLLRANTQMIELYVKIQKSNFQPIRKNTKKEIDEVIESAHEIRQDFLKIPFLRGAAIMEYIMHNQSYLKKKIYSKDFFKSLAKLALKFQEFNDIQAVEQCKEDLQKLISSLKAKNDTKDDNRLTLQINKDKQEEENQIAQTMKQIDDWLESNVDMPQERVHLTGKMKDGKLVVNKIENMLVNPQICLIYEL